MTVYVSKSHNICRSPSLDPNEGLTAPPNPQVKGNLYRAPKVLHLYRSLRSHYNKLPRAVGMRAHKVGEMVPLKTNFLLDISMKNSLCKRGYHMIT